ncbi:unnamed protein product [Rotaria sp. Silwood2]|nr:unnamed protein product [Rotaria sp. Silwood2]CAF4711129.1 unnamed protein product [Rotaria sp. Silwood2]
MTTSLLSNPISIVNYRRAFNIDLGSITEYFSSVLATDGNLDRGALKNGNLLFKDHFIHSINIYKHYAKRTISAKCRAQMKKSTTYNLNLIINTNNPADILEGICECVAGSGQRSACKHLAALCFALLDYDQNKLYEACTERLQEWHQPTRRSTNPIPLLDIRFTCLQHNRVEEKKSKYWKFLEEYSYVPAATTTLRRLLLKYDQQSNAAACFLLPQQTTTSFITLPARVVDQVSILSGYSID